MREKEAATRVYFVRHGQTDYPLDRIYCDDQEDPPLNENGSLQVAEMAKFFVDKPISAIYSSPAQRTKSTATAIANYHDIAITESRLLMERRFGIWEGLYFHEIEQQYPREYLNWKRDNVGFAPANGENIEQIRKRLIEVLEGSIEKNRGESIVIVSHVGPIRVLLCESLSIPLENYRQIHIDYASISCVDYGKSRNNLVFSNLKRY